MEHKKIIVEVDSSDIPNSFEIDGFLLLLGEALNECIECKRPKPMTIYMPTGTARIRFK